jgi:hypothetical protein
LILGRRGRLAVVPPAAPELVVGTSSDLADFALRRAVRSLRKQKRGLVATVRAAAATLLGANLILQLLGAAGAVRGRGPFERRAASPLLSSLGARLYSLTRAVRHWVTLID